MGRASRADSRWIWRQATMSHRDDRHRGFAKSESPSAACKINRMPTQTRNAASGRLRAREETARSARLILIISKRVKDLAADPPDACSRAAGQLTRRDARLLQSPRSGNLASGHALAAEIGLTSISADQDVGHFRIAWRFRSEPGHAGDRSDSANSAVTKPGRKIAAIVKSRSAIAGRYSACPHTRQYQRSNRITPLCRRSRPRDRLRWLPYPRGPEIMNRGPFRRRNSKGV